MTDTAVFNYKCDNFYNREAEGGIRYNDPTIGVAWPVLDVPYQLSPKDEKWALL